MIRRTYIGLAALAVLCSIPVVLWCTMVPLGDRFGSFVQTTRSIGQLSALIGFVLFSISLILIARLQMLERLIGGLDRVFKVHRHLGMAGFLLMLLHPIALSLAYLPLSTADAALFFIPTVADMEKSLGIISLVTMMLLLTATLYASWRYQLKMQSHRLLGLAFILGAAHAFLIPSDISSNMYLALYLGIFAFGAITAYLYRTIFASAVPTYSYRVSGV